MSLAWIQGRVREAAPKELPSLTGPKAGLFETILVRDGAPLLLEAHLERLTSSAHAFGDLTPPDSNELAAACRTLPGQCNLSRARMRITLVPGQCAVTLEPFDGVRALVLPETAPRLRSRIRPAIPWARTRA